MGLALTGGVAVVPYDDGGVGELDEAATPDAEVRALPEIHWDQLMFQSVQPLPDASGRGVPVTTTMSPRRDKP